MDELRDQPPDEEPLEVFYGREELFEQRPQPELPPPPPRRARTATGAILTGIALGLRDVFDPTPKDKIAIEQEAPGLPAEPQRFELRLQGGPRGSSAIYRPWVGRPDDS